MFGKTLITWTAGLILLGGLYLPFTIGGTTGDIIPQATQNVAALETPQKIRQETSQQRDARMQWWRDDRFGMFIHWGLYSIPAGGCQPQAP